MGAVNAFGAKIALINGRRSDPPFGGLHSLRRLDNLTWSHFPMRISQ